jgi:hypothetical protein
VNTRVIGTEVHGIRDQARETVRKIAARTAEMLTVEVCLGV